MSYISIFTFSLPLILASASDVIMSTVDTAFIGHVGKVEIAAVGLSGLFVWAVYNLVKGILVSVGTLVSQNFGAKQYRQIVISVHCGLLISLIAAVLFFLLRSILPFLLSYMNPSADIQQAANTYLSIRFLGAFGFFGAIVFAALYRSLNLAKFVLITSIFANFTNILLDYLLIFTFDYGIQGAAIATVISQWLSFAIYIVLFIYYDFSKIGILENIKKFFGIELTLLKKLLSIGIPYSLKFFSEVMIFYLFIMMSGWLSVDALAVTTIMFQIVIFTNMTASGIGHSAQVLVGQKIGAKELDSAKKAGRLCVELNLFIALGFSIILVLFSKYLIMIFNSEQSIASLFSSISFFGACMICGDGLQMVAGSALNGACDTKIQFKYMMIYGYVLFVPLCYILTFDFKLQLFGAWIAMAIFILLLGFALTYRFYSGQWEKNCNVV